MPGHAYLGLALLESGKPREAIPALEDSQKLQDIVVVYTWLIRAHRAAGDPAKAEQMTKELEARGRREYLPPYYMAALYGHGGDRVRAFAELERALREKTGAMVWTKVDPALDPLRGDARFAAVVGKTHALR
jgi:tetratricopeptide (TPR) repeat protein